MKEHIMTMEVRENVPLAPLTTFGIGGPARYFVSARTDGEIRKAIIWARDRMFPFRILAGGSNVLSPDEGVQGIVIRIVSGEYSFKEATVRSDAGCDLLTLIREGGMKGLGGWEKIAGIPGSIGGAVRGNAGAFGSEIKDFAVSVRAFNAETGGIETFTNAECRFAYRNSFFKQNPEWIILDAEMVLQSISPQESERKITETIAERERRHLQNVAAAGSYFMNPQAPRELRELFEREKGIESREGRVPAGWLIENAGMKGAVVGGAIASIQHPNYIVNRGGATAKDVLELAEKIKNTVRSQFGVALLEEAAIMK